MSRWISARTLVTAALALATAGCAQRPPTQLVFRVDADQREGWLDLVRLRVRDTSALQRMALDLPQNVPPQRFPLEWGLLAGERDRGASIEVIAEGYVGARVVSQQRALVSFVNDRIVRIDLHLNRDCTVERETECQRASGAAGVPLTCGTSGRCVPALRTTGVALDRDGGGTVTITDASVDDVSFAPDGDATSDSGIPTDTSVGFDSGVRTDSGVPTDSGVRTDSGSCVPQVLINEIQLSSATNTGHEYVELYNKSACPAPLEGWTLIASQGMTTPTLLRFESTHTIAPGGFFVVTNELTPLEVTPDQRWPGSQSQLDELVGGVQLRNASSVVVDRVAWRAMGVGVVPNLDFVETAPVQYTAAPSVVLARWPGAGDIDHNAVDFQGNALRSPRAANP